MPVIEAVIPEGGRVRLSPRATRLAGPVHVTAWVTNAEDIAIGDEVLEQEILSPGDSTTLGPYPKGINLYNYWVSGQEGDFVRIGHGGGF